MIESENYHDIQKELQEGRLSEALDLLLTTTEQHPDRNLKEDLLLIKSKFEYTRNQYEIKGILTDQEFNIQYSKATLGAQDILHRLQARPHTTNSGSSTIQPTNYRPLLIGLLLVALLGISWWGWQNASASELKEELPKELTEETSQQENTSDVGKGLEDLKTAVTEKPEKQPEKEVPQETKPPPPTTVNQSSTPTPTPPKENEVKTEPVKEITPAPPAKTFEVNIIKNSDMGDAKMFVDGQKATIISNTSLIMTIQVTQKQGMHLFELRKDGNSCERELLINKDQQKINFNCN